MNEINKNKRLYKLTFTKPVTVMVMLTPDELKDAKGIVNDLALTDFPMDAADQVLSPNARITYERIFNASSAPEGWTANDVPWLGVDPNVTIAQCIEEGAKQDKRDSLAAKIKALQTELDALG